MKDNQSDIFLDSFKIILMREIVDEKSFYKTMSRFNLMAKKFRAGDPGISIFTGRMSELLVMAYFDNQANDPIDDYIRLRGRCLAFIEMMRDKVNDGCASV